MNIMNTSYVISLLSGSKLSVPFSFQLTFLDVFSFHLWESNYSTVDWWHLQKPDGSLERMLRAQKSSGRNYESWQFPLYQICSTLMSHRYLWSSAALPCFVSSFFLNKNLQKHLKGCPATSWESVSICWGKGKMTGCVPVFFFFFTTFTDCESRKKQSWKLHCCIVRNKYCWTCSLCRKREEKVSFIPPGNHSS